MNSSLVSFVVPPCVVCIIPKLPHNVILLSKCNLCGAAFSDYNRYISHLSNEHKICEKTQMQLFSLCKNQNEHDNGFPIYKPLKYLSVKILGDRSQNSNFWKNIESELDVRETISFSKSDGNVQIVDFNNNSHSHAEKFPYSVHPVTPTINNDLSCG